jgi:hypothetical protein
MVSVKNADFISSDTKPQRSPTVDHCKSHAAMSDDDGGDRGGEQAAFKNQVNKDQVKVASVSTEPVQKSERRTESSFPQATPATVPGLRLLLGNLQLVTGAERRVRRCVVRLIYVQEEP